MELRKLALIAEIVGGAAILVTLVILIAEIRANSQLIERQIILDRVSADAQIVDSPYIAPIWVKIKTIQDDIPSSVNVFMKSYDLTLEEAVRLFAYIDRDWTVLEADFNLGSTGVERRARQLLQSEDIKIVWLEEFSEQETEFAKFVNDLID